MASEMKQLETFSKTRKLKWPGTIISGRCLRAKILSKDAALHELHFCSEETSKQDEGKCSLR